LSTPNDVLPNEPKSKMANHPSASGVVQAVAPLQQSVITVTSKSHWRNEGETKDSVSDEQSVMAVSSSSSNNSVVVQQQLEEQEIIAAIETVIASKKSTAEGGGSKWPFEKLTCSFGAAFGACNSSACTDVALEAKLWD